MPHFMIKAPAVLEINTASFLKNVCFFRSKAKKSKIMAVVKAAAYGTEILEISKILQKNKIDYLAVAYVIEGIFLRKNGITIPILVLHPQISNFKKAIQYNLELTIYNFESLFFLRKITNQITENANIHLKIDTGLHRLGFDEESKFEILKTLKKNPKIQIKGIFSHLAASEDLQKQTFTKRQIQLFQKIATFFLEHYPNTIRHLCNTSGTLNFPQAHFDMVRIGMGLYGFDNTTNNQHKLKNVLSLTSHLSQIKMVKKGESIGYNHGFICEKNMKIGVVPMGHHDGIHRALGKGKGVFYVKNTPCKIVGNVCMDMLMIDLCEVKNCKVGDSVIIFNTQKQVVDLAKKNQTIPYEMLTGIGKRVARVFV